MKWIGQHIWDFISRFRSDVYIDDDATLNVKTIKSETTIDLSVPDDSYIKFLNGSQQFGFTGPSISGETTQFVLYSSVVPSNGTFAIFVFDQGSTKLVSHEVGGTAAHFEIEADGDITLDAAGQIKLEPGTSVLWDSLALTGIQASGEIFADNDTSLMTSAAIQNKIQSSVPNLYDNTIKLIPSDFGVNDDGGNTKFGVGYIEVAGSGYGMRSPNSNAELFAFVSIPQGMKATHVNINAKSTYSTEVFEVQIDDTTVSSKGTGNCNTNLGITEVESSATNFLAIMVSITATTDKVYGGTVTIAAI